MMTVIERRWREHFGDQTSRVLTVKAPGRVNIIGEHTDYNDGFVFPAAIDKFIAMAGTLREDNLVRVYSVDFDEEVTFSLDDHPKNAEHSWLTYLAGVARLMRERGLNVRGMDLAVAGTIPQGSGLSSSAALEMAMTYMIQALHGFVLPPFEAIKLCQRVEHEFVGVKCGIMDQYISCLGKNGQALLIDCRTLDYTPVPLLKPGVKLVITNCKVKHNLADSAYNERRQQCEDATKFFSKKTGVEKVALRDVTPEEFKLYSAELPEILRKRAEHVIFENKRVLDGMEMLKEGNLEQFGMLMYQSHYSLKDLYEVSCAEIDVLVSAARGVEGVYGSRITGGGFGGCTVSLVRAESLESFITSVGDKYRQTVGIDPEFYICDVVDGAECLNQLR